ncbi:MAG: hypothetical protein ABI960_02130 [Candidatus Eisenbacteria bacterium]
MRVDPRALHAPAAALRVGVALTLLFLATAGGRITSSDEYTMYRLTESLVTRGTVWVDAGNAERGPDGRLYPKAGIGQALAAAPFYGLGRVAALPFAPAKRELVTRAVTALLNAFVGGLLGAFLFLLFLEVGTSARGALFWTLASLLATPLWVYAKSFLTEPLLALGLAAGLYGALRFKAAGASRHALLAGLAWGGVVLVKYAMAPAVLLLALPFVPSLRRTRAALPGVLAVLLCLALALLYNIARTGIPFGTGYGRQATAAAFSTPLFVGLYGLLLSSGKGIVWFAPLVVLVPIAAPAAVRRLGAAAWGILAACVVMLLVYATFEHWAGDGSWGPRYLVPLVPLALLLVAAGHAQEPWGGRGRRVVVGALATAGLLVTLGGVAVYFGAEMREAGDYPYTRALDDPSFMAESHFNPWRSPIAAHWRMARRNAALFVAGQGPKLTPQTAIGAPPGDPGRGISSVEGERLAVAPGEVQGLTRALDFWWAYAVAAGVAGVAALALALALWLAFVLQAAHAWAGVRRVGVQPLPQAPDSWIA